MESECAQFYAERMGRPSLCPGRYFRLLLVGYFEGLDSERGIAWRAQDSLSIRRFLGLGVTESAPDHSTISRTRRLVDVETHSRVFSWVLGRLAESGLVSGKTVGVDATTLEANAALRSIVRLDSGEDYDEFVRGLAEASGVETPTRTELVGFDRKRKKKLSNAEWENPHDPDAEITKMKDGRTHFAYKAEQAVDLESGTILGVTVQGGSKGDTESFGETLEETFEQVESATGTMPRSRRSLPTRATTATPFSPPSTSWAFAATSRSRTVVVVVGRARRTCRPSCTRTVGGSGAIGASGCSASEGNGLNGLSLTSTRPAACGGCTCAVARTSSSASTFMPAAATSGS